MKSSPFPSWLRTIGIVAALLATASSTPLGSPGNDDLHRTLDRLLERYATEEGVRYAAWAKSAEDRERLRAAIGGLADALEGDLEPPAELAAWINLYNAVTLDLILEHYPVKSIKETAGFLRSPWNKKLVTVSGRELSLNQIEHDIIRERFPDSRIHFALNCASLGCPPLLTRAYRGELLDEQLDAVTRRAVNDPRWVRREGNVWHLSRIFDWYEEDFRKEAGSVAGFLGRYRSEAGLAGDSPEIEVRYFDYDWTLNEVES